ncbi:MAG: aminotransferase class I/II-fold pyridoxal phosphate-dependent enzyme [Saprospiraceae bacterium]|nr:aminotransferase class I/II-fold pyridoxal phosphate-dependent enzyme [Saprospiraceae bacterium]
MYKKMNFSSLCAKEVKEERTSTPHQLPIYAASTFQFNSIEESMAVFKGEQKGDIYSRFGNPTINGVAQKIANLEAHGSEIDAFGFLCSSGMAAISTLMFSALAPGDKVLTQGNLYGGTTDLLLKILGPLNIQTDIINLQDLDVVEEKLKNDPSIKMIYFETPANPTLDCLPILQLSDMAKRYDCITVADNTFCTPYLQQPFLFGVDFIVHSTTKYLNGHGNSIAGVLVGKEGHPLKAKIFQTLKLIGTNCNSWDAWLINNGMKTLAIRMDKHSENAQKVAEYLSKHPKVIQVNYPGLLDHPDHHLAKAQMRKFGGMLSFELDGGLESGKKFMNHLQFCTLAPTLGDVDTLILHPASMSHINVPPAIRAATGITDGLVRISVGIEAIEDIIQDLEQAIG